MRKHRKHHRKKRNYRLLLSLCSLFVAVYFGACWILYNDNKVRAAIPSNLAAETLLNYSWMYSSTSLRTVGEALAYRSHRPELVQRSLKRAVQKAPANHINFSTYASYLSSRACCADTIPELLREFLRRSPTNPARHHTAGYCMLAVGDVAAATVYFRRTIELEPEYARQIYRVLSARKLPVEVLITVTPPQPKPFLSLTYFLANQTSASKQHVTSVFETLIQMSLNPEELIQAAQLAIEMDHLDVAELFVRKAEKFENVRTQALERIVEIAWKQQRWNEYQQASDQLESIYRAKGNDESAARVALQAMARLNGAENRADTKQRLLQLAAKYPKVAEIYWQMALITETESQQLFLYYVRKACELRPEQIIYRSRLAATYLKLGRISEAKQIYRHFLTKGDQQVEGYIGLAECSLASGDRLEAIELLQKAISLFGRNPQLVASLEKLQKNNGKGAEFTGD